MLPGSQLYMILDIPQKKKSLDVYFYTIIYLFFEI